MAQTANTLIETLGLAPHPEGGWYREMWRGPDTGDGRAIGTSILFLLEHHQSSHWHTVDAFELWLWQAGDPLDLLIAKDDTSAAQSTILGPGIETGQQLQAVVPIGEWQAARPVPDSNAHGFSLVSCVVTPGFDFAGFELAAPGWEPGPHN